MTALTRNPDNKLQGVEMKRADYETPKALVEPLRGHDWVIILISRQVLEPHCQVIDAAIEAGVPNVIPSCFGLDTKDPRVRGIPALEQKVQMEDYVIEKAEKDLINFVGFETSMFLEWGIQRGIYINLHGPTRLIDGGGQRISLTSLEDIGVAIVAVLRSNVRNRFLFLQSIAISQNEMMEVVKELKPEKTFEIINVNSEEAYKKSWEAFRNGDTSLRNMAGFLVKVSVGFGCGLFKHVDNEILGIRGWNREKLKEFLLQQL